MHTRMPFLLEVWLKIHSVMAYCKLGTRQDATLCVYSLLFNGVICAGGVLTLCRQWQPSRSALALASNAPGLCELLAPKIMASISPNQVIALTVVIVT